MADNINITLPDGNTVQASGMATDQTLNKMIEEIDKLSKLTKQQKDAMKKVAMETAKGNNTEEKQNKELIKAINEIKDESKGGASTFLRDLDIVGSGLKVLGGTVGLAITALSTFVYSVKALGDDLRDTRGGTSLDLTGSGDMNTGAQFRTSMQMLGYSADELNARFQDTSQIVAVAGRKSFFELTKEIQNLTGAGGNLGMSLVQIGEALDNDLKLRQQIGILNMLDGNKQAKRSALLYEMQLKATAVLGKSIDEISGSADDTLTTNASVQLLLQSMGEGSQDFVDQIQRTASEMSAAGLSQGVNNAIQNAMLESVAFRTDAGGELFKALAIIDRNAGTGLAERIQQINALSKSDPIMAAELMKDFGPALVNTAKDLSEEQLAAIRPLVEGLGDVGDQIMLSIGQMRQAGDPAEGISELAQSAATFDNALKKFNSSIAGSTNALFGAFGTPLSQFMNAFTEGEHTLDGVRLSQEDYEKLTKEQRKNVKSGNSIFETLNEVLDDIMKAFTGLFGKTEDATGKVGSLADLLRDKLNPFVKEMGASIVKWIDDLKKEDITGFIDSFIMSLKVVTETVGFLATAIGKVLSFITVTETDENGVEQFDLGGTIMKAIAFAFGASIVKKAISLAFSGATGKIGGGIMNKLGMGGGGVGDDLEGTGKKAGKGAKGMAAFGVAAAGVGIALLGVSSAFETFRDMEWGEFGKSIGMLGLALLPFAIGIAAAGIAGTAASPGLIAIGVALAGVGLAAAGIGAAAAGISMLFDSTEDNIKESDAMTANVKTLSEIEQSQLEGTAKGIEAIADSLNAFGDATNDGWFSGPDISDQYEMLNVFKGFASLDSENLKAFTSEMSNLINTINDLNAIDTAEIIASASALKKLNDATSSSFGERLMDTVDMVANRLLPAESPAVNVNSASPTGPGMPTASAGTGIMGPSNELVLERLDTIAMNSDNLKKLKAIDKSTKDAVA